MISSNMKITCYFHMWKYHLCYGYMINRTFRRIKLFLWNGLVFHWCLYNKQNITWPLGDTKFLFSCWKYFTRSLRSLVKYFSTLEEKFRISAWLCNILYVIDIYNLTLCVLLQRSTHQWSLKQFNISSLLLFQLSDKLCNLSCLLTQFTTLYRL